MEKYIPPKINKVDGRKYLKNIIEYYENTNETEIEKMIKVVNRLEKEIRFMNEKIIWENETFNMFKELLEIYKIKNEEIDKIKYKKEVKKEVKKEDEYYIIGVALYPIGEEWEEWEEIFYDLCTFLFIDIRNNIDNNVIDNAPVILRNPNDYEQWN